MIVSMIVKTIVKEGDNMFLEGLDNWIRRLYSY